MTPEGSKVCAPGVGGRQTPVYLMEAHSPGQGSPAVEQASFVVTELPIPGGMQAESSTLTELAAHPGGVGGWLS